MRSITINEVARQAGVSIKTVSRVMNREPNVRSETRSRVLAAVAALDYTPNVSARALAGARTYLIGLYVGNPSDAYMGQLQNGVMRVCRRHGYHLLVEQVAPETIGAANPQSPGSVPDDRVLGRRVHVDGAILSPPLCDDLDLLDRLDAVGTPYVRIAPSVELDRAPLVDFDDRGAAYAMTTRLIALGHRRLAFVSGPDTHAAAARRREGFIDAIADRGLSLPGDWLERGDFSFRSGAQAAERLLSGPHRPTALFAGNDDMALGVMSVATRLHLDIPHALSLVGFDDTPSAQVVWPRLTTVRQPVADMAAAAAEMIIDRAPRGAPGPVTRRLDFDLVFRDSTAPPPADAAT